MKITKVPPPPVPEPTFMLEFTKAELIQLRVILYFADEKTRQQGQETARPFGIAAMKFREQIIEALKV